MKKRQRLTLIVYINAVLFISFIYVPYIRHYTDCSKRYVGHKLRYKLWHLTPWESGYVGNLTIDASLIMAELLVLTAVTFVIFLLLKREN